MRELYIVLIQAHTGLGAVARRLTGYPYTHVAVSLDPGLRDFMSYSRRYHSFPFEAGFTHEFRDYYAFGDHRSFRAKVFRLELGEESYRQVLGYLDRCREPGRLFNLFSMATMTVMGGFRIWRADNCMSFTARVCELSGIALSPEITTKAGLIWKRGRFISSGMQAFIDFCREYY